MGLLEWFSGLDIGVADMNSEHKQLLSLMNRLYDLKQANAAVPDLKRAIKDLADYTVKHFADEEKYLETIQFPEIEKHKLIHKDLLKNFSMHVDAFDKSGVLDEKFFAFLKMWLSAHIQGVDMKYGQYSKTVKK